MHGENDSKNDADRMRALMNRVGTQPGPPLRLTADGIARRGRRIRVARWGAGVAAGLVAAAAITTAVVLGSHRDLPPATPPPATPTETPTTTDIPTTTEYTTTTVPPEPT